MKRSCERMNSRNLEHVFLGEVGQYRSRGARKQRFPRSRRAIERDIVCTCGGYDKTVFRGFLSAYLIKREIVLFFSCSNASFRRREIFRLLEFRKRICERIHSINTYSGNERRLFNILFWHVEFGESSVARGKRY